MTIVSVNPGGGPVDGDEAQAIANIQQLIVDAKVLAGLDERSKPLGADANIRVSGPVKKCRDGRYSFVLALGNSTVTVDMPGLPIDQVRYLGAPGQNAWHYPRLYVDGSSWLWEFALVFVRSALRGE